MGRFKCDENEASGFVMLNVTVPRCWATLHVVSLTAGDAYHPSIKPLKYRLIIGPCIWYQIRRWYTYSVKWEYQKYYQTHHTVNLQSYTPPRFAIRRNMGITASTVRSKISATTTLIEYRSIPCLGSRANTVRSEISATTAHKIKIVLSLFG